MFHRTIKLSKTQSFFLFGARGTGKSSLLRALFPTKDLIYIDLLDSELANKLSAHPNRFLELLPEPQSSSKKTWVIVDEVQKVPDLLDLVQKKLVEKNFCFALTGSSERKLKRGAANLLAGRAVVFTLFPLTHLEIGKEFQLQKALEYGTLPECWNLESDLDRRRFLKSYSLTYLKEEIIEEQIVRNLPPFRRFLEVAANQNSDIINYSNIAKDIHSDPKTVSGYFEILEDTLLGFRLPAFSHSIRKRQKLAPKFYFFDTGVVRALSEKIDFPVAPKSSEYGQLFESFIINEIHRVLSYAEKQFKLSYIRVDEKQEIDLVVERHGLPTFLCEIKSSSDVDERNAKNLENLGRDMKNCIKLVISNDPVEKKIGACYARHWTTAINLILDGNLIPQ